jgi:8-oxo-dGTP pyrophosphatase MutT (NUDIX family)
VIKQVGSREVYANPWMRVREDAVEYPDGSRSVYSVLERRDFVTVLPVQDDGYWIVEQYRYPLGSREWEFPQGAWPAGKSGTIEELGRAELVEETGLTARTWQHLGRLLAAPGLMAQGFDVFLASDLTEGEPSREHTEQDMVHRWVSRTELLAMVRVGRFADCHSVAALSLHLLA